MPTSAGRAVLFGKRQRLAGFTERAGIAGLAERWDRRAGQLICLAYHRVGTPGVTEYVYDDELISASVDDFDWQLRYVKAHYDVIGLQDLHAGLEDGRLPARPLVITFDDGYRDNFTHAYPVLRAHGLPAVFFLTSDLIGSGELFWFEKLAHWLRTSHRPRFTLGTGPDSELPLGPRTEDSLRTAQSVLKGATEDEYPLYMKQLEAQFGCDFKDSYLVETLRWDDVRDMAENNMEFGAHSMTHAYLPKLSEPSLRHELQESKRRIEHEIGSPINSLSYPGGQYNETVKSMAREIGYTFGVAFEHGTNQIGALDRFALRRIPIERDVTPALFRMMLRFPYTFRSRGGSSS